MTCPLFQKLARSLPPPPESQKLTCQQSKGLHPYDISDNSTLDQIRVQTDPAFGWHAVERLCEAGVKFPIVIEAKITWLFRAYLWKRFPQRYGNHQSVIPVIHAWSIMTEPANLGTRALINAALIAKDSTIASIARTMNLPAEVLEAYDALFFNMTDRREDRNYLRHVAYPNTRLEEQEADYLKTTSLDTLLLRIGYNRDLKTVLHAAGRSGGPGEGMTASEAAESFRHEMLLAGCRLVASGSLNRQKLHPTIRATLDYLKASKRKASSAATPDENEPGLAKVTQDQLDQCARSAHVLEETSTNCR